MHVHSAVFSQLQGGLRSGNPIVDAVVTSVLFGLLTFLSGHAGLWWQALQNAMLLLTRSGSSRSGADACLSIPVMIERPDRDIYKYDYSAIALYMSTSVPVVAGKVSVTNTSIGGTSIVLPVHGQALTTRFEGHDVEFKRVRLSCQEDVGGTVQSSNDSIEISVQGGGGGIPLLMRLLSVAQAMYVDSLSRATWKQKMYRLSNGKGASATCKWTGALTHSTKTFDSIVLDAEVKRELVADVTSFLGAEAWYASMGVSYKRGYLLHGPPGTGKSSIVLAIAGMAKADIYCMNLSAIDGDAKLDEAFGLLPERCVVVFEDIDCMSPVVRSRSVDSASSGDPSPHQWAPQLTLSALLNNLDGAGANHGRIFVMTTNHPELLDPALVRAGRADLHVRLGMCTLEQLLGFFALFYPDVEVPEARLAALAAAGPLSPAEVSSAMLHHRHDPAQAIENLWERADAVRPS